MGNIISDFIRKEDAREFARVIASSDFVYHRNQMDTHGCGEKFRKALEQCNPEYLGGAARNDDACAEVTAALRRCMEEGCPVHLPAYVRAMDEGIDEDDRRAAAGEPPLSGWDVEDQGRFRWWTGMKRT